MERYAEFEDGRAVVHPDRIQAVLDVIGPLTHGNKNMDEWYSGAQAALKWVLVCGAAPVPKGTVLEYEGFSF